MAGNKWQLIHDERDALAADLESIGEAEWASPSLCDRWTVRDVVAHMTATAMTTPPKFFVRFVSAGFSFPKFADQGIARHLGSSGAETLAQFRAAAHRTTSPPGPGASWIGEAVVHAEDVRRPLGISHTYRMDALRQTAAFYSGSNAIIGSKNRIAGVKLSATDTDWTSGDGPVASGPMLALLMSMTGRHVFLDQLTGKGVQLLRSRT